MLKMPIISPDKIAEIESAIKSGKTNEEIKNELGCGWQTVEKIRQNIGKPTYGSSLVAAVDKVLLQNTDVISLESLCDKVDASPVKVRKALELLKQQGKTVTIHENRGVELARQIPPSEPSSIDISRFKGKKIRFGLTSDNHLCSKYYRADVLNALYDIWQQDGITKVYQCGNMIDGEARFNKFDLVVYGMQAQAEYFAEHWPAREGMTTEFITGDDHEGWYVQREGVDIGKFLQNTANENGRDDLIYLGHMEHDIRFTTPNGSSTLRLIHAGGGTAYALSYKPQSIINSYQGGEKPQILLIGHYHKAEFNYWREVLNVQAGCTEDQTPFMRKKNIQAHVGGWTIEFELDDDGLIHGFTPKWYPFYDLGFYQKGPWAYRWKSTTK